MDATGRDGTCDVTEEYYENSSPFALLSTPLTGTAASRQRRLLRCQDYAMCMVWCASRKK